MSQTLIVNGIEYVPAGAAGKHFGYTRDYMLILARDEKIVGQKIGHRWYINISSAEKFFNEAKIVREERKQKISYERKEELKSYSSTHVRKQAKPALFETIAILGIGLVIGVTGYIGIHPNQNNAALAVQGETSFFKQLAASFFNLITPNNSQTTEVKNVPEKNSPSGIPHVEVNTTALIPTATTTHTSLVIAPDQVLTTTTVASIRDSFSDDVSVSIDPQNPDTGIIIPHFKDADGEAYRYLIVPVTEVNPNGS